MAEVLCYQYLSCMVCVMDAVGIARAMNSGVISCPLARKWLWLNWRLKPV